jgi:hypothetical protein
MTRQAELNVHGSVRPSIIGRVLVLCAVAAVALLLFAESCLSLEQRQQTFEASGVYP